MSKESVIPFRHQLDEVCKHLEKWRIERERKHLEFTKRFDDIVARHDRLTTCRLRRLSLEGIEVDFDLIRGNKRKDSFQKMGETDGCHLPGLRRAKTDINENTKYHFYDTGNFNDCILQNQTTTGNGSVYKADNDSDKTRVEDKQLYKQLRLELSFDSKHPNTSHLPKKTRVKYPIDRKLQGNKSFIIHTLNMTDQKNLRKKNKFQRAYTKVIHAQRFTAHRRHTILSMAPIEIGEKTKLPSAMVYDKNDMKGHENTAKYTEKASPRAVSPRFVKDRHLSRESDSYAGKHKFKSAIKTLENGGKVSDTV